jgi:abhydrolase domain-containing protein 13
LFNLEFTSFSIINFKGILYNLQDIFVYHPQEPPESKIYIEQPSIYNLPYEVVELNTKDSVKLHSYLLKQPHTVLNTAPTIVYFHGNAGILKKNIFF